MFGTSSDKLAQECMTGKLAAPTLLLLHSSLSAQSSRISRSKVDCIHVLDTSVQESSSSAAAAAEPPSPLK